MFFLNSRNSPFFYGYEDDNNEKNAHYKKTLSLIKSTVKIKISKMSLVDFENDSRSSIYESVTTYLRYKYKKKFQAFHSQLISFFLKNKPTPIIFSILNAKRYCVSLGNILNINLEYFPSIKYFSVAHYLKLTERIKLKSELVSEIKSLSPLLFLRLHEKDQKSSININSLDNKYLKTKLELDFISLGQFKTLRQANFSHQAIISLVLIKSISSKRKNYYQKSLVMLDLLFYILKNKNIKKIPITITSTLMEIVIINFNNRDLNNLELSAEKIKKLIFEFYQYNQFLGRRTKVKDDFNKRELSNLWLIEINRFRHLCDWILSIDPQIHKNQKWFSLVSNSENWNHRAYFYDKSLPDEWDSSLFSKETLSKIAGKRFEIIELSTPDLLRKESQEMLHCIASYAKQIYNIKYVAFSLIDTHTQERATVGYYISKGKLEFSEVKAIENRNPHKIFLELVDALKMLKIP